MPVVVVTDSSSCLGRPEVESALDHPRVRIVPLHVLLGNRDFREGIDTVPREVIGAPGVSTSGASVRDLADAYDSAVTASEGAGVVALHLSRSLSSTWEAARTASLAFDGAVRVIDSGSTALGLGFAAASAATVAAAGADLDEVYHHAVRISASARCLVVVDRLDHLRRGGRISAASSLLGTALSAKPVLHIVDGVLTARTKVRTSSKAISALIDAAVDLAGTARVALAVHHVHALDRAQAVAARLAERITQVDNIIVTDLGDVLGVHLGTGAIGVALVDLDAGGQESAS